MDPGTGNIYTADQAKAIGLDFDTLIPLSDDEATAFFRNRIDQAAKLKRHKVNKAARQARKRNR